MINLSQEIATFLSLLAKTMQTLVNKKGRESLTHPKLITVVLFSCWEEDEGRIKTNL